ncbi:MAG: hypothetical protein ACO263_04050 [Cyclobacteriaceae bacterium]|jgi:hypothetical protein
MAAPKKKIIKSLDNLSEDLQALIQKQYPNGYESSLTRISTPKKEPIFVFPLETDDTTYLVKIPATKNSEGDYDVDFRKKDKGAEFGRNEPGDDLEPDSDSDSDDVDQDDDYDDEGMGRGRKDPSYDPDFDN